MVILFIVLFCYIVPLIIGISIVKFIPNVINKKDDSSIEDGLFCCICPVVNLVFCIIALAYIIVRPFCPIFKYIYKVLFNFLKK